MSSIGSSCETHCFLATENGDSDSWEDYFVLQSHRPLLEGDRF